MAIIMAPIKSGELLNWPNLISVSRIVLIAPTLFGLANHFPIVTLASFAAIIASDFIDGLVARKLNHTSQYGTLVDHGSDAIVVIALSAYFAHLAMCTWALPIIIALAFVHYAFDSRPRFDSIANLDDRQSPRPSTLGRINGIAYFIFVGVCIAVHHGGDYLTTEAAALGSSVLVTAAWLLTFTTALSI